MVLFGTLSISNRKNNLMTHVTAPQLNEHNATRYKANPAFNKQAVLVWTPARYVLSWGVQEFEGPHMLVDGDTAHPYGCALEEFFTTHKPVLSQPDRWYKNVEILALQLTETTEVVTLVDGKVEARSTAPAGHWVIRNPKGEQYCTDPTTFAQRYLAPEGV